MPGLNGIAAALLAATTAELLATPAAWLFAAPAAWLFAAPAAGATRCQLDQALPRVSLKTNPGRIVYNSRKSRQQIKALQGHQGSSTRNRNWHPIGLTLTELKFRMKISIKTLPTPGRGHCATLSAVEAELGYGNINVYVDKRYRKGS